MSKHSFVMYVCLDVSSLQRSAMRMLCWATRKRGGSMMWWEARSPAAQVTLTGGASTSTGASRPTSPQRTSSTCSLEVASPHVSNGTRAFVYHQQRFWAAPVLTRLFLSTASPHTFNNGRTSYSHETDYRQERTDDRGDVRMSFCCLVCVCCRRSRLTLVFPVGRFLYVHPADAHRGPDHSVHTEPDDGVAPSLQPLLQTVRAPMHTRHTTHKHSLYVQNKMVSFLLN